MPDAAQPWLSGLFSRRPSFDFSLPPEEDQFGGLGMHENAIGSRSAGPSHAPTFGPSPSASIASTHAMPGGDIGMIGGLPLSNTGTNDKWGTTAPVVKSD